MNDPRDEFISRIDLKTTRVKPFRGFFFLCGGPHKIRSTEGKPVFQSIRHIIYDEVTSGNHGELADRLRRAEDIQDWFRGGKYADLVTFEEHLASLSSVILLVVESAGSIAELGAFSVTKAISDRLIAVVAETHYVQDSFIRLGPISRLESDSGRKTLVYDWHEINFAGKSEVKLDNFLQDVKSVLSEVQALIDSKSGERIFRAIEPGHIMLMMCELCDLFGALQESELHQYILTLAPQTDPKLIDQFLFLLEKCDLLRVKPKGHGRYFYAPDWKSQIVFGYHGDVKYERSRVSVDVFSYYKEHNKTRADVIRILRLQS